MLVYVENESMGEMSLSFVFPVMLVLILLSAHVQNRGKDSLNPSSNLGLYH